MAWRKCERLTVKTLLLGRLGEGALFFTMRILHKTIWIIILLFCVSGTSDVWLECSKSSLLQYVKGISFEPNSVYIFLRGSDTKLSGFAKRYNASNTKASHVALAIYTDSLRVYHVNTTDSRRDNLIIETFEDFSYHPQQKHSYLGIWKLQNVSQFAISKIQEKIAYFKGLDVRFDYRFDIESDQKLYCSEFIYKALSYANNEHYQLPLTVMEVPKEHRFFLKTDTLHFYPTDFFLAWNQLEFVAEWDSTKTQ